MSTIITIDEQSIELKDLATYRLRLKNRDMCLQELAWDDPDLIIKIENYIIQWIQQTKINLQIK